MAEVSNAQRLRQWLLGCEAIDAGARFGVDWLSDEPTEYALMTVPSPLRWRENVLGERMPEGEQAQDFLFEARAHYGADTEQNLRNLALFQGVADWIAARSAAGDFPEWSGGEVTGVAPSTTAALAEGGAGAARYQMRIRVTYRIN